MNPTPELRFIEREVVVLELSTVRTIQVQRILQQFWSNGFAGEWRDVPVEVEKKPGISPGLTSFALDQEKATAC